MIDPQAMNEAVDRIDELLKPISGHKDHHLFEFWCAYSLKYQPATNGKLLTNAARLTSPGGKPQNRAGTSFKTGLCLFLTL